MAHKRTEFSTICKIARQKLQKKGDRWERAHIDKRLKLDRFTATSFELFLEQHP